MAGSMRDVDSLSDPAQHAAAVVPNDAVDLAQATRGIYIGVAGNLTVTMVGDLDGTSVTFLAAPVGVLPVCVKRVWATGTAATNLLALW